MDERTSILSDSIQDLSKEFIEYQNTISAVSETMKEVSEEQKVYQETMQYREEMFEKINEQLNLFQSHFGEAVNYQQEVAASYEETANKNHLLIQEVNNIIEKMNAAYENRDHQFEGQMESLKTTFKKLEDYLGSSMNDGFKDLVKKMGDYITFTNKLVEQKLKEMGLLQTTLQEGSSFHIQQTMSGLKTELDRLNQTVSTFTRSANNISTFIVNAEEKGMKIK
ncbi:hypothetical protein [Pseudalkalibacillus caeni]|uniref:Uncharacterized protein n=1 Tax=Exobacillus caeni TaxID=2574798 RepID=A0A5R9FAB0_9BACL|nr:hypothetical protein [Pseudalkalibacillus caeni]TLS38588.1 hypothetical protein FCL54_03555 [Pseudalkalibacillus caeni]